jgi:hypothetical protein
MVFPELVSTTLCKGKRLRTDDEVEVEVERSSFDAEVGTRGLSRAASGVTQQEADGARLRADEVEVEADTEVEFSGRGSGELHDVGAGKEKRVS